MRSSALPRAAAQSDHHRADGQNTDDGAHLDPRVVCAEHNRDRDDRARLADRAARGDGTGQHPSVSAWSRMMGNSQPSAVVVSPMAIGTGAGTNPASNNPQTATHASRSDASQPATARRPMAPRSTNGLIS